jgi:predicted NBD/HSP70 family sugar kinase/mannose-6-phosphate isomerase class I
MFKHSNKVILSADIGGSHITTGLIKLETLQLIPSSVKEAKLDARAGAYEILMEGLKPAFEDAIEDLVEKYDMVGIAIAMPGPFDYERGIFRLSGLDKFGNLYGVDLKRFLYDQLHIEEAMPIFFKNDADCFGLGAYVAQINHGHPSNGQMAEKKEQVQGLRDSSKLIGITLGTGLGSAFVDNGDTLESGTNVPAGGHLYNQPLQFAMDMAAFEDDQVQEGFFSYGISEELISTRGLLQYVNDRVYSSGQSAEYSDKIADVKQLAKLARLGLGGDAQTNGNGNVPALSALALEAFKVMGFGLGTCLKPWYEKFRPATIVLGGGIAGAADLFLPSMRKTMLTDDQKSVDIIILNADQMQATPLIGAAYGLKRSLPESYKWIKGNKLYEEPGMTSDVHDALILNAKLNFDHLDHKWRKTHQTLLPICIGVPKEFAYLEPALSTQPVQAPSSAAAVDKQYDIFPYHSLGSGKILSGFEALAKHILYLTVETPTKTIAIDGYQGVDWLAFQKGLSMALTARGYSPTWVDIASFAKPEEEIERLVAPFLGTPGAVWGSKTDLQLMDLFDRDLIKTGLTTKHLKSFKGDPVIIFGSGAGLCGPDIPVVFVELPKNEIQYRMRAGTAGNLLTSVKADYSQMYKRSYFVDWPILDQHRERIMSSIEIVVDAQWRTDINWCFKADLDAAFKKVTHAPIRVRPWFAPGAWGGDWMKNHFNQLSKEEVNYAWSFELIVPENGIVFESDNYLLEVPFDMLMASQSTAILGSDAEIFGHYFPIRFDFLDTFHGGNLSIQCHPSLPYIKAHFGEMITQDETYYILDAEPGAGVYLGFQHDIDPEIFRAELERSHQENAAIDITQFVQLLPAKKHDLFLIPNQTVHSAGANNLVLEISATPYIFTFKMYDWVRPDLNGKPRPINIDHAFKNLDFSRKGQVVQQELCVRPEILESNDNYSIIDLPTHPEHFYAIRRFEIKTGVDVQTLGKCQIMMVVEGGGVLVELPNGKIYYYGYAETFIIPAAVESYKLVHPGQDKHEGKQEALENTVKVIQAFTK